MRPSPPRGHRGQSLCALLLLVAGLTLLTLIAGRRQSGRGGRPSARPQPAPAASTPAPVGSAGALPALPAIAATLALIVLLSAFTLTRPAPGQALTERAAPSLQASVQTAAPTPAGALLSAPGFPPALSDAQTLGSEEWIALTEERGQAEPERSAIEEGVTGSEEAAVEAVPESTSEAAAEPALHTKSAASATPASAAGLSWPLVAPLSSLFGAAHPLGIDLAANLGTPVRAAGDGRVRLAAFNEIYGWFVILDHPRGYTTVYAHFAAPASVRTGQGVARGDLIGIVGDTGRSFGPHLHFEVHLANRLIDPLSALPRIPLVISPQAYRLPAVGPTERSVVTTAPPPPTMVPAAIEEATPTPTSAPVRAGRPDAPDSVVTVRPSLPPVTAAAPSTIAAVATAAPSPSRPPPTTAAVAVQPSPVATMLRTPLPSAVVATASPRPQVTASPQPSVAPMTPRPTPTRAGGAEAAEP